MRTSTIDSTGNRCLAGCKRRRGSARDMDEKSNVLIIGAGPSGAVSARYLAERGFSVTCLEQGRWHDPSEFAGTDASYELRISEDWHKDQNVRQLPEDYPTDTSESDLSPVMYNAVGGGTIHYGALWTRLLPVDFRVKTLDGLGDDWPISYEDLEPFYDLSDIDYGCSGLAGDPVYPPGAGPVLPPMPISPGGRKFAQGMNAMGWHWWPGCNAIASTDYRHLKACVRYGVCVSGCPNGSKASADLVHWPEAIGHGAKLITGARVREVTVDKTGLASGATYIDRDGIEHHQRADVVIMAANGIGTARLLLLSESAAHPNGLANSSDLVGRRLMLHPHAAVIGIYDEQLDGWMGPAGEYTYSLQFHDTDRSRGHVRGAKWEAYATGGPMVAHWFTTLEGRGWGPGIQKRIADLTGRSMLISIGSEDLPDPENRIVLDPVLTDSDGIPAPRVQYRLDDNNVKLLAWHRERAQEVLAASGATDFIHMPLWPDEPGHLLGTARMGHEPETSVVDAEGRSHDVANLFVVDGSVFVTSGVANPTSTISANALRCVTAMVENANLQTVPA